MMKEAENTYKGEVEGPERARTAIRQYRTSTHTKEDAPGGAEKRQRRMKQPQKDKTRTRTTHRHSPHQTQDNCLPG